MDYRNRKKRRGLIKNWVLLVPVIICVLTSGCVSDISNELPHNHLIGTTWRVNQNMYVVENFDGYRGPLVVPCEPRFGVYIPHMKWDFDVKRIGESGEGERIIGAVLKGEIYKVGRVLKQKNIEMGDSYYPMAVSVDGNKWIGSQEVNLFLLYKDSVDKGVLNPDYVEKVE